MTPEEIALRTAEISLQKAQAQIAEDLIKIGIPSAVAMVSAITSFVSAIRNKSVDKKISDAEQRLKRELSAKTSWRESRAALLERKRNHIEAAASDFDKFSRNMAIYFTQAIARSEYKERDESVPTKVEEMLKEYDRASFDAFTEANHAKRLLSLIGFSATSEKLISIMRLSSAFRRKVQACQSKNEFPLAEFLKADMAAFRLECGEFLEMLQANFDSLVLSEDA